MRELRRPNEIPLVLNRESTTKAVANRTYPTKSRLFFGFGIGICLASLLGIIVLYSFHIDQNEQVLALFSDALDQHGDERLEPEDLVSLSHNVCTLRTSIGSVGSFIQPISDSVTSGGWCGNYVRVFILLAQANGYEAQKLHLRSRNSSHTMAEILYEGKWRQIDPFFNIVYQTEEGELATFQDIHQRPALSLTPHKIGAVSDPRLDQIYDRYRPIFPALFADSLNMDWRLNQSSIYHSGILTLNYFISPFYEGPRRAVIPNWLDSPEFIGIYALTMVFLMTSGGMGVVIYRRRLIRQVARRGSDKSELSKGMVV